MVTDKLYTNISIQKKEDAESEVEITGEINEKVLAPYRTRAIKKLGKEVKIDGFRKGHIPEKVLIEHIGEQTILYEIAEFALQDAYPKIVEENKLDVIGQPEVRITKLAPGNPIGFSIATATFPKITLPDYKTIASNLLQKEEEVDVSKEEMDKVIEQILKSNNKEQSDKEKKEESEELTDEIVKKLGDFKDVEDFKKKLEESLRKEKVQKARESKRVEMGEKIIEASTMSIPRILVDSEIEKMIAQFRSDIERAGVKYDDYLKQIKKEENDLRKEWEKDAGKRAKLQLILNEIARIEKIRPDEERVGIEIENIVNHVSGADKDRVRIYVETMLTNEKVFLFLEDQLDKKPTSEPVPSSKRK